VADYRISPFYSYTEGAKIVLHPQKTFPNMGKGFTVAPGNEASVMASYTERELRPHPYGNCQKNMKLDIFDNIRAENVWNYTPYACTSLCYQSKIIKECGCLDSTEITFPALTKQHRFCSLYNRNDPEKWRSEKNCTRGVKSQLDDADTCINICPPSCAHDDYGTAVNQVSESCDDGTRLYFKYHCNIIK
jgi:hypothetical protein